jgi:hypothetical protein
MSVMNYITAIKLLHTLIWGVMVSAIFYILYCGVVRKFDVSLYIAIGLISLEIITLLINKWSCPLTIIANKIDSRVLPGEDVYLPKWLAMNTKNIFGSLFILGLLVILVQLVFGI